MMALVGIVRPGSPAPVHVTYGAVSSTTPLVVLLHGRGSNERDIITLAPLLPHGPAYAALRAPIPEDNGFAWFNNVGIGRPVPESLTNTMSWFRAWLADVAPPRRRVFLIGFSGGAAFAGGIILDRPRSVAGAALLSGTLPFNGGVPTVPDRLAGLPIFLAHGDADAVIPADLVARTWAYLLEDSGADVTTWRDPGAHEISKHTIEHLSAWLTFQLHLRP